MNTSSIYDMGAASQIIVGGNTTISSGTLCIGDGVFDANGTFNASNATITFASGTSTGTLKVAGDVSSFGSLSSTVGTVEYDGVIKIF